MRKERNYAWPEREEEGREEASGGEREQRREVEEQYGRTVGGREIGREGNVKGGTLEDTGQYTIQCTKLPTTRPLPLRHWYYKIKIVSRYSISTTNLAACVCVSSKFDQFLPGRFYFVSKRPENFVRIAKFPYAAFGPLFAFHCPLFVTKNNNLGWNRHASPHTGTDVHGPTVL